MTDYSYSESQRACCECREEVALLQRTLTEVHGKLMAQIEISKEQQIRIMMMQQGKHGEYDTFGKKTNKDKENLGPNRRIDDSEDGIQIKNQLLQADLQAMRHRVLTEITEKNRLLEEMGDLKKRHRKELALEVKKFEGLQILYRRATGKQVPLQECLQQGKNEDFQKVTKQLYQKDRQINQLNQKIRELSQELEEQREKARKAIFENKQLRSTNELNVKREKERIRDIQSSGDQLREIDSLKQQISRINKNITLRQQQYNRDKTRRISEEDSDTVTLQTKLVGESRWGKRLYS